MSSGTKVQDVVETEQPAVPQEQTNKQKNKSKKPKKKSKEPKEKPKDSTEKPKDPPPATLRKFFRFATKLDIFLMVIGTLTSMANGVIFPLFSLVLGDFTGDISPGSSESSLAEAAKNNGIKFMIVGVVAFGVNLVTYWCWVITGARQTKRYRDEYFKAMLRQPISYFDTSNPNEFASRMASETDLIEKGLSEKMTEIFSGLASIVSGFAVGYAKGWELSTVLLATIPVLGVTATLFAIAMEKESTQSVEVYSKSGGSAEQALGAMRTVASLTGEPKELTAYQKGARAVRRAMMWFIVQSSFSFGVFFFSDRSTYALGFWFGSLLIGWKRTNVITGLPWSVSDVLTVFFTVTMASASLGFIAPSLKAVTEARAAAARVNLIIDKEVPYSYQEAGKGEKKERLEGDIEFKNVEFAYPSKPGVKVLNNMNFKILKNKKNALVGESGCGKSTCMQLLERFYDVDAGSVEVDGKNIKDYNVAWLRQNIGYIGQEPVLFSRTIKENLLLAKPDATDEELWEALRKANAEDFVRAFKDGLDTHVGSTGTTISGGQKQRIAIARVILKNPSILLLDEATSALDRKNEHEIQKTLDDIAEGRTSIVIAHRLTTIQNADRIFVFDKGVIVEQGTHEELIQQGNVYYHLQKGQISNKKDEKQKPVAIEDKKIEIKLENNYTEIPLNKIDNGKDDPNHPNPIALKGNAKLVTSPKESLEPKSPGANDPESNGGNDPKSPTYNEPKSPASDEPKSGGGPDAKPPAAKDATEDPFAGMSEAEKKKLQRGLTKRLFEMNKPERGIYYLAVLLCLVDATIFPLIGLILAHTLKVISLPDDPDFRKNANLYSLAFFLLGFASIFTYGFKQTLLGAVGQRLTERMRTTVFDKMLRMHIGWFDEPKNLPGILTTRLAVDAQSVNTLTAQSQAAVYQGLSSIIAGLCISFTGSWQLGLVALGAIPFFIIVAVLTMYNAMKDMEKTTAVQKEAGQYLSEALVNIRTVAGLSCESDFLGLYSNLADKTKKTNTTKGIKLGILIGLINLFLFGFFALLFYAGTMFISHGWIDFQDLFQSIFGIVFAAFDLIWLGKAASDIGKGLAAAASLFQILDTPSKIDYMNQTGPRHTTPIVGEIEFRNVKFEYPTRKKQIFDGLSFTINANTKVALVGPSGCGKSTIMQLLLRFYDVDEGEILIDGKNIKEYDIHHLRKSFGLVSQEPFLFNGTVEENIA
mgnify:CR=1 FL=1